MDALDKLDEFGSFGDENDRDADDDDDMLLDDALFKLQSFRETDSTFVLLPTEVAERAVNQEEAEPRLLHPFSVRYQAENLVVAKIENIFESFADSLLTGETEMSISLPSRFPSNRPLAQLPRSSNAGRRIRFPGRNPHEAWRFTTYVRVLQLVHEALMGRTITTKRDIYYKDPALFGKQSVVDRLVDDIALAFEVPRACLNVVAAAKGLVAGKLSIKKADGCLLDVSQESEGSLISMVNENDRIDVRDTKWILVVEKEAVFHSLLSSEFRHRLSREGILITGKGYPDIATRALLNKLVLSTSSHGKDALPIFGLVDYDPDGVAIMSTYKHGSASLQRENGRLQVPSMQWLGLRSEHIFTARDHLYPQGLLPLSTRDRWKATKMLGWEKLGAEHDGGQWRSELQIMLMLNFKAEIELLASSPGGLDAWLAQRLNVHPIIRSRESKLISGPYLLPNAPLLLDALYSIVHIDETRCCFRYD